MHPAADEFVRRLQERRYFTADPAEYRRSLAALEREHDRLGSRQFRPPSVERRAPRPKKRAENWPGPTKPCHPGPMARFGLRPLAMLGLASAALAPATTVGCSGEETPALSKASGSEIPDVPVPPADGPKLGAVAEVVPVLERPAAGATQLGYLHAGALVARAEKPYGTDGCAGGWYPIRPRGFVCAGELATVDLAHPTLAAMKLAPKLDQALPYTYARVLKDTSLFERDPAKDDSVREVGKRRRRSLLAIVGSWKAKGPDGVEERLGLTTNGRFARARDLEPAEPSSFKGVELDAKSPLPVGFVVKRGVRAWNVEKGDAEKLGQLAYHEILPLTGRFRTSGPLKYWAVTDGRYVRHRDVTVVRQRNAFPDFAVGDQKWIDVSVVTGVAVLYEGKKPVFTTLVSVGRDRLGDPKSSASTAQGTFEVVGKQITASKLDPKAAAEHIDAYDVPWVIELSSGQLLHGASWHDRFGIEHGPGNVQLSPADAARVWQWSEPAVPDGWHGVRQPGAKQTMVVIRK
jgi:hypothetical protein